MSDLTLRAWFKQTVSDLGDGTFALLRMTLQRALHVNLRDNTGAELGTVANPINVSGSAGSPNINVAQIGGTAQSGANVVDVGNTALRVNVVAGSAGGGSVTQGTTPWVVGQATGTNLHVVVDSGTFTGTVTFSSPQAVTLTSTTITGNVAVTNAGLSNIDTATSVLNTSLATIDTDLKATQPRSIVGTVSVTPTTAGIEHSDLWTQINLLRQILVEIRGLRMTFSTVSGTYVANDDIDTQIQ